MYRQAFKFRLYPTHAQETTLRQTLETCRHVYNSLLHQRKVEYELSGKSISYSDQQNALPIWKQTHPELREVHSQVLQDVCKRVDLAFQAFFQRIRRGEKPGYPRFKGAEQYDSVTYPQSGFTLGKACVTLSKIGAIKAILHRPVEGKIKTCSVRRYGEKWFVCFSCEVEDHPLPESAEQIGIDVGLEKFAALSNGEFVENPRFFRKDEQALAKAQRKFGKVKHKHRSKERHKARKEVARIHERIRNRRHDFVHKTARQLVARFGLIAIEKLNVAGMVQNHHLAKSIADASWSMFLRILTQKAERAARVVIAVNPAYTSQDCSECGHRSDQKKTLSDRWHVCPVCGLSVDRDTNSAQLILKRAVGQHSVAAMAA